MRSHTLEVSRRKNDLAFAKFHLHAMVLCGPPDVIRKGKELMNSTVNGFLILIKFQAKGMKVLRSLSFPLCCRYKQLLLWWSYVCWTKSTRSPPIASFLRFFHYNSSLPIGLVQLVYQNLFANIHRSCGGRKSISVCGGRYSWL